MNKRQENLLIKLTKVINDLSFECEIDDIFNEEMFELNLFKSSLDDILYNLINDIERLKERGIIKNV